MNDLKSYVEMLIKRQGEKDAEFKALLLKKNKTLDECCKYLTGEALKQATGTSKCKVTGWSDDTMTGQIIHYYQEDSIKVNKMPSHVTTTPPQPKTEPKPEQPAKVVKLKRKVTIKKKEGKNPKIQELSLF